MAGGITTPKLVSAVSNLGGVGSYASGYVTPSQLLQDVMDIQEMTPNPYSVNLFVPSPYSAISTDIQSSVDVLQPLYELFEVEPPTTLPSFEHDKELFLQQIELLIELKVPICSFTFGIPSVDILYRLRVAGVYIIGTATSVSEALAWEKAGADGIVAQACEAGGHRGSFLPPEELLGFPHLLSKLISCLTIPVIATGGIMNKEGIDRAMRLGQRLYNWEQLFC